MAKIPGKAPEANHPPTVLKAENSSVMQIVYKHNPTRGPRGESASLSKSYIGELLPGIEPIHLESLETTPLMTEGYFRPESVQAVEVFGQDGREQVDPAHVQSYPLNMIAQLEYVAANNKTMVGTGWLIHPRILVTAGHCVWDKNAGNFWVRSMRVHFGRVGNSFQAVRNAVNFSSVTQWTQGSPDPRYDFGAVFLDEPVDLGWFGTWSLKDSDLIKGVMANVVGYPGDKYPNMYGHGELLSQSRLDPQVLYYTIDTKGGQSGAPVIVVDSSKQPFVVGIHNNYVGSGNAATRINSAVEAVFKQWRAVVA